MIWYDDTHTIQALAAENYRLSTLLGLVTTQKDFAAKTLLKINVAENKLHLFLNAIIQNELSATSTSFLQESLTFGKVDPNTVFRGNSMASKAIDVYQKMIGLGYLQSTLRPLVLHIQEKNRSCEMDPMKVEKGEDTIRNKHHLELYCRFLLAAIFESRPNMPQELSNVYRDIRKCVHQRFPDDAYIRYTAISGFLFLRFFCAAILGPKLFGLVNGLGFRIASCLCQPCRVP